MGWSRKIRDFAFPLLELFRPIPILAWVPLSVLLLPGFEGPVIFLATLASLFVTTLNSMLGVDSIDEEYFRAAGCLGSKPLDVFRNVVVPGALPFIFTGLQISVGVAWFSLVAAEMVSGDFGLGYLIVDAYMNNVTVPMVIGMLTLGFIGYLSSILVRMLGNKLMQWHVKELAQQDR
jgi:NitT/TauT family transport system permease protein